MPGLFVVWHGFAANVMGLSWAACGGFVDAPGDARPAPEFVGLKTYIKMNNIMRAVAEARTPPAMPAKGGWLCYRKYKNQADFAFLLA